MRLRGPAAALLLAHAACTAAFAQSEGEPPSDPPQAYVDCANAFAAKLANGELPVFSCGGDYFGDLPGSVGTTADMNDAYVLAIAAGETYRTKVLMPALVAQMKDYAEDQEVDYRARLDAVLAAADEANRKLCELEYDLFSGGTIRTLVAGSCRVQRDDQLMGALLDLQNLLRN